MTPALPEGLPELPPVPKGYDRWEHRGTKWSNDDMPCVYSWTTGGWWRRPAGEQYPHGDENTHYLEAVRASDVAPEQAPAEPSLETPTPHGSRVIDSDEDPLEVLEAINELVLRYSADAANADGNGTLVERVRAAVELHEAAERRAGVLEQENARLLAKASGADGIILQFGDGIADLFNQLERGNWIDDHGHEVKMNYAMLHLQTVMRNAMDFRAGREALASKESLHE